jgi:hypothetical protein
VYLDFTQTFSWGQFQGRSFNFSTQFLYGYTVLASLLNSTYYRTVAGCRFIAAGQERAREEHVLRNPDAGRRQDKNLPMD